MNKFKEGDIVYHGSLGLVSLRSPEVRQGIISHKIFGTKIFEMVPLANENTSYNLYEGKLFKIRFATDEDIISFLYENLSKIKISKTLGIVVDEKFQTISLVSKDVGCDIIVLNKEEVKNLKSILKNVIL